MGLTTHFDSARHVEAPEFQRLGPGLIELKETNPPWEIELMLCSIQGSGDPVVP